VLFISPLACQSPRAPLTGYYWRQLANKNPFSSSQTGCYFGSATAAYRAARQI